MKSVDYSTFYSSVITNLKKFQPIRRLYCIEHSANTATRNKVLQTMVSGCTKVVEACEAVNTPVN